MTSSQTVEWIDSKITDEGVAELRAGIGVESHRKPTLITAGSIARYANGIGDDNPLYWDAEYAGRTKWKGVIAPPTLVYSGGEGMPPRPGEPEMTTYTAVYLPGVFGMWVGDRWKFHEPAKAGDEIHRTTALHDVQEKRTDFSGRTVLHTERIEYKTAEGVVLAELLRTLMRFERKAARENNKYLDIPMPHYTEDDWRKFDAQWSSETEQRRGDRARYWDDVNIGDDLGKLLKGPLTVTSVIAHTLGNGGSMPAHRLMHRSLQENPLGRLVNVETGIEDTIGAAHWDDYFAQMSGLPRSYDFGGMRVAWVCHLLSDWMGDEGFLRDLHTQLKRPNVRGDITWMTGKVVGKRVTDDGQAVIDCEVEGTNQRGERSTMASAAVELPRR